MKQRTTHRIQLFLMGVGLFGFIGIFLYFAFCIHWTIFTLLLCGILGGTGKIWCEISEKGKTTDMYITVDESGITKKDKGRIYKETGKYGIESYYVKFPISRFVVDILSPRPNKTALLYR